MSDLLSQDEIDALMDGVTGGTVATGSDEPVAGLAGAETDCAHASGASEARSRVIRAFTNKSDCT